MSSTRKPKPPDKGAPPEHKPSRKVALEEVMRSLQDLVSNELSTDATPPVEPPKRRRAADKPAAETSAPMKADARREEAVPEVESITLEGLPDIPAEIPVAPETPLVSIQSPSPKDKTAKTKTDPSGIQQELPYLDALPELPAESPIASAVDTEQPGALLPDAEPPSPSSILDFPAPAIPHEAAPAMPAAAQAIIPENWDDIPVLEEAVDMADISDTDEGHAGGAMLPHAGDARRLAIQVAARLNVELRKSGQPGLSSEIITRLARMLEEALAKGTANVENTKKH